MNVAKASLGIGTGDTIYASEKGIDAEQGTNILLQEHTPEGERMGDRRIFKDYRITSLYDDYRNLVAGADEHVLTVLTGGVLVVSDTAAALGAFTFLTAFGGAGSAVSSGVFDFFAGGI